MAPAAASNAGITTRKKRKGKYRQTSPEQLRDSPEEEALSPVPLQEDEEEVPQASGSEAALARLGKMIELLEKSVTGR